jgi:hypothetical protein
MFWVVQENIKDEATYDHFIQALYALNIEHTLVKVVPFSHDVIPDVNPTGRVMVWGSTTLDLVAKNKGWKPGTFLNENFDQRIWRTKYPTLNDDAEIHEFGSIPAFEGTRFIRPVHDMKVFAGKVIHNVELEQWKETIQRYSDGYITLRPETPVSISSVKDIEMEWRFFVVSGKVVAGSRYRQWGLSDHRRIYAASEPWKFAQEMVDRWQPSEAFVIDLAKEHNDPSFKVIEVNCINSAGFYECDMKAVIEAIERL